MVDLAVGGRSQLLLGAFHAAGVVFFIHVMVFDRLNESARLAEGKIIPGFELYAGRYKYLTQINLVG